MSVLQCTNACQAAGFAYAGVEYSSECYCDNSILTGAKPASNCNMLCSGNNTEYCGGPDRVNIYQSNSKAKTAGIIPSGWTAQGCVKDNVQGRALPMPIAVVGGPAGMTIEGCVIACLAAGYTVAGVEYAQECWCGNTIQNGGVATLPGDGCNMPCRGNTIETCGGSNRLNVYANYPLNLVVPSSSASTVTSNILSLTTQTSSSSSSSPLTISTTLSSQASSGSSSISSTSTGTSTSTTSTISSIITSSSTTTSSISITLTSSSSSSNTTISTVRSTTTSSSTSTSFKSTTQSTSSSITSLRVSTSSLSSTSSTSTSARSTCSPTSKLLPCIAFLILLTFGELMVGPIYKIPNLRMASLAGKGILIR
ncbi:copper radical oxidase [Colletotrichum truncatum]|uniref:Copper radical oxidase n=1 Tax=Colletotrichum truncatum TaxID=5467 RepID=A0ACC3Z7V9_COLTU|nr:copper radical oxidase [Colletotrichum truncatum]KAF6782544.1 copper radical oxidase [Colletotrichum truncatum]